MERTRFLVHIWPTEDVNRDDPADGYAMLNQELLEYNAEMADKPQIKVINKIDTLSEDELADLKTKIAASGETVYFISALTGEGVDELLNACGGSSPNSTKASPYFRSANTALAAKIAFKAAGNPA